MAKTYFYNEDKGSNITKLIEKSITQNGVFNAVDDEADGYSKISVFVEAEGGGSEWSIYQGNTPPEIEDKDALFLETHVPASKISLVGSDVQLTWASREYDTLPSGIPIGNQPAQVDADVYFVGGASDAFYKTYLNTVYKYNFITKTVTQLSNYPLSAYNISVAGSSGKLYCFGGKVPPVGSSSNSLCTAACYCYDIAMDVYTGIAAMPIYSPACNVGICENEDFVFMMGGVPWNSGKGVDLFFRYDKSLNTWAALPNLPKPFPAGIAGIADGILYFSNCEYGGYRLYTYAYSFETNTWSDTNITIYRSGVSLDTKALNGKLFFIGGKPQWSGVSKEIEVYDIATGVLSAFATSLAPRAGCLLAAYEGKNYLIGRVSAVNQHIIEPLVEELRFDYTNTDKTEDAVTIRGDLYLDGLQINEKIKLNNISAYQAAEGVTKKLQCKEKKKGEEWK